MSAQSPDAALSLPSGGGSVTGVGETFAPDPFTGTAGASIPIPVLSGRGGLQPALSLAYSAGSGNGPFGVGWTLSVPGVARKTEKGLPRYRDAQNEPPASRDTFVLSGAEDLVPVVETSGPRGSARARYRPRTEGLFAQIERIREVEYDYWRVQSPDGTTSIYGLAPGAEPELEEGPVFGEGPALGGGAETVRSLPATVAPDDPTRCFAWHLARTEDAVGNRIVYEYEADGAATYLKHVRYDAFNEPSKERFLHSVTFVYEDRPDPFSDFRAGFEIRIRRRCVAIEVRSHASGAGGHSETGTLVKSVELRYLDHDAAHADRLPVNGVSLLHSVEVVGHDGNDEERLPPLTLSYSRFQPERRRFSAVEGPLPGTSLGDPTLALVDLDGRGLPDLVQLGNGVARRWRNLGGGRFEAPRALASAPPVGLDHPAARLLDADGDGLPDLLVADGTLAGTFPLRADAPAGLPNTAAFRPYRTAPSIPLSDPGLRLLDLDGDGITDALYATPGASGAALSLFYHHPDDGWTAARRVRTGAPPVDLADPRTRTARLSGAVLDDLAVVYRSRVEVWPNLGYGRFAPSRSLTLEGERLPTGFDPARVVLGDFDGDGLDDLAYLGDGTLTIWFNQSGNALGRPVTVRGLPRFGSQADIRLVDLLGAGTAGLLVSQDASAPGRSHYWFLDLTGGVKPYLLTEMSNGLGATTRVGYRPSTYFRLADERDPDTRWSTPLPMPVQVVHRVESIDHISGGRVTQEFAYHHGYWDGREREFRGFGRVDRRDIALFAADDAPGPLGAPGTATGKMSAPVALLPAAPAPTLASPPRVSAPVEVRTWFHLGGVAGTRGAVRDGLFEEEYWPLDPVAMAWGGGEVVTARSAASLDPTRATFPTRGAHLDALRALRGTPLRSETYALDGSVRADRPYTVTEQVMGVRQALPLSPDETPGTAPRLVVFPYVLASRTTEWDRGDDPHRTIQATSGYDAFGRPARQASLALPRGRGPADPRPSGGEPVLVSRTETEYATPFGDEGDPPYLHAHPSRVRVWEIEDTGAPVLPTSGADGMLTAALGDDASEGTGEKTLLAETLTYYDGAAFEGRTWGKVGPHGLVTRTEQLRLTDDLLDTALANPDGGDAHVRPYYLDPAGLEKEKLYPQAFHDSVPELAGFVYHAPGTTHHGGFYAQLGRTAYDLHEPGEAVHGLPRQTMDALGTVTVLDYDTYRRLPVLAEVGGRLATVAEYDYRTLQPSLVTDPNGNRTAAGYSPLGLVAWTALLGQDGQDADPLGGVDTLATPSARFEYDLRAFHEARGPASATTVRRVHHATAPDVPPASLDETITSVAYSDGFGRVVQTRTQAEEVVFGTAPFFEHVGLGTGAGTATQSAVGIARPDAVVVSGYTVFDDKGRPVETYEPFFDTGLAFAPAGPAGDPVYTFYDARGRAVRTVAPDGTETRVVFGLPADLTDPDSAEPSPWVRTTYDAIDNAGRTHSESDQSNAAHWNTPASATLDALGRVVEERQRLSASAADDIVTRFSYDLRGNRTAVVDPLGRLSQAAVYDLTPPTEEAPSLALQTWHHEAGLTQTTYDAAGAPVETRAATGALVLASRDALGRPEHAWARDRDDEPITLRGRTVYGDDPDAYADQTDAAARNLRGAAWRVYDEAGLAWTALADAKGNALESHRRVVRDDVVLAPVEEATLAGLPAQDWLCDWTPPSKPPVGLPGGGGGSLPGDDPPVEKPLQEGDYAAHAEDLVETRVHTTRALFDALSRPRWTDLPADADDEVQRMVPTYNRAGAVEAVHLQTGLGSESVQTTTVVERVAYDARGERVLAVYGNGLMTRLAYHAQTRHLARIRTERYTPGLAGQGGVSYVPAGGVVQDTGYVYDLGGRVTAIRERAPGTGVGTAPNALNRAFQYDAIGRLTRATGREAADPPPSPPWALATPRGALLPDPALLRSYVRRYDYDAVSALTRTRHSSPTDAAAAFTRLYVTAVHGAGVNEDLRRDRLARIEVNGGGLSTQHDYTYDAAGQLVREGSARHVVWGASGKVRSFRVQVEQPGGTAALPSVYARYLYDGSGARVRKVTRQQDGGGLSVTTLGAVEREEERSPLQGTVRVETTTRLGEGVEVRAGTASADDGRPAWRQTLTDRSGSGVAVVGGSTLSGAYVLVSREEYYPYGETSVGGAVKASVRFDGKGRDAESGYQDYGLRTYASWTGRFVSVDPLAGQYPHLSAYGYAGGMAVTMTDLDGAEPARLSGGGVNLISDAEAQQVMHDAQRRLGGIPEVEARGPSWLARQWAHVVHGVRAFNEGVHHAVDAVRNWMAPRGGRASASASSDLLPGGSATTPGRLSAPADATNVAVPSFTGTLPSAPADLGSLLDTTQRIVQVGQGMASYGAEQFSESVAPYRARAAAYSSQMSAWAASGRLSDQIRYVSGVPQSIGYAGKSIFFDTVEAGIRGTSASMGVLGLGFDIHKSIHTRSPLPLAGAAAGAAAQQLTSSSISGLVGRVSIRYGIGLLPRMALHGSGLLGVAFGASELAIYGLREAGRIVSNYDYSGSIHIHNYAY